MSVVRPIGLALAVLLACACIAPGPSTSQTEVPMATTSFTLTSSAFGDGGTIPREFSCDGENASPPLSWRGAPEQGRTIALIVDDPDARGFVHWVVYDIAASATGELARGVSASPDAPAQGRNGFGNVGYGGPCPPNGTHHYAFRLLALDAALDLPGSPSADQVRAAAEGHVLAEARLTATYTRAG